MLHSSSGKPAGKTMLLYLNWERKILNTNVQFLGSRLTRKQGTYMNLRDYLKMTPRMSIKLLKLLKSLPREL